MATDLRDEIDRSFGVGPSYADDGSLLDAGRRALLRRRLAAGGLALAVAVVVAGGAVATLGGSDPSRTGRDPASTPTSSPSQAPPYTRVPAKSPALDGQPAALDRDGQLLVRKGAEVLDIVQNPLEVEPPRYSTALATRVGGTETWSFLEAGPSGGSTSSEPARQSFPDLRSWVQDQVAMQRGEPTLSLVAFARDGSLTPEAGVQILEQRSGVDMGPSFAGRHDRTAVAEVRWKGERWFVLARHIRGSRPEYFPTAASVSRPTLDGFLEYARASYDDGTGLR